MRSLSTLVALLVLLIRATFADANDSNALSQLSWQRGPGPAVIGDKATISIPPGYVFLDSKNTARFMEITQNPYSADEYVLAPEDLSWFAVFHFNPVGYVKDNESIDSDELLKTSQEGSVKANDERRKRGWGTISIEGWRFPPRYDRQTNLLEWALTAREDKTGKDVINYNTRLLGREGVMEVTLVSEPSILDNSVLSLKSALTGYKFAEGEKYADFRQGDRVAEFGLAALVAGGAAAVAAKKGIIAAVGAFLVAAWKFLAAAVVGFFAWLRSLIRKKQQ